jgi:hypothetical protein
MIVDLVFEPSGLRTLPAEVVCAQMAAFFGGSAPRGHLAEGFLFEANGRAFRCHIADVRADGTPVVIIRPEERPTSAG